MTTDTITAIAFAILASAGWLAFAKEYRAHRGTKGQLYRLTDRDERGRFVKRERV